MFNVGYTTDSRTRRFVTGLSNGGATMRFDVFIEDPGTNDVICSNLSYNDAEVLRDRLEEFLATKPVEKTITLTGPEKGLTAVLLELEEQAARRGFTVTE